MAGGKPVKRSSVRHAVILGPDGRSCEWRLNIQIFRSEDCAWRKQGERI